MKIQVHTFTSTSAAYSACQCDENIRDGDILVIESEKVIGIANCWPLAVTKNYGALHTPIAGKSLRDISGYRRGIDLAEKIAKLKGFELLESMITIEYETTGGFTRKVKAIKTDKTGASGENVYHGENGKIYYIAWQGVIGWYDANTPELGDNVLRVFSKKCGNRLLGINARIVN